MAKRVKTAWTSNGSDITPLAERVMEIVDQFATEGESWGESSDYQSVVDKIKDGITPFVMDITQADVDCLEDYNYHIGNTAIAQLRTEFSAYDTTKMGKTAQTDVAKDALERLTYARSLNMEGQPTDDDWASANAAYLAADDSDFRSVLGELLYQKSIGQLPTLEQWDKAIDVLSSAKTAQTDAFKVGDAVITPSGAGVIDEIDSLGLHAYVKYPDGSRWGWNLQELILDTAKEAQNLTQDILNEYINAGGVIVTRGEYLAYLQQNFPETVGRPFGPDYLAMSPRALSADEVAAWPDVLKGVDKLGSKTASFVIGTNPPEVFESKDEAIARVNDVFEQTGVVVSVEEQSAVIYCEVCDGIGCTDCDFTGVIGGKTARVSLESLLAERGVEVVGITGDTVTVLSRYVDQVISLAYLAGYSAHEGDSAGISDSGEEVATIVLTKTGGGTPKFSVAEKVRVVQTEDNTSLEGFVQSASVGDDGEYVYEVTNGALTTFAKEGLIEKVGQEVEWESRVSARTAQSGAGGVMYVNPADIDAVIEYQESQGATVERHPGNGLGTEQVVISHPTGTMTYIVTPNTPSRPGFGLPKQSQSLNSNDWYDKSEYVYVGDAIVGFIYHLMSGAWGYQNLAATRQEEGFSTPEEAKSALLSVVKTAQFDLQVECIVCGSEDVEILTLTNTGYLCDCLECGARFNYEEDEFLEPEEGSDLWWLNQQLQDKNAQSIDVSTENRYHTPPCPECDSGVLRPVDSDGEPIDSFDSPSFDGFECDECGYFTDDVRTAQILPMQTSIECPSCHSCSVSWVDGDETGDTYICDMCDEEFDVMVDASDPFTDILSDAGIFLD
jgi:transcription elongation factor Elf1